MISTEHLLLDLLEPANILALSGAKLLPDFFLDEAEAYKEQFILQTPGEQTTGGEAKEAASDTPEGVFQTAQSFMTPEIVKEVNATFLFVVDGKYPGEKRSHCIPGVL